MSEPKWLKDKDSWVLSESFVQKPCKAPHPKVGDQISSWLILGVWVNSHGTLKAFRVQCKGCGSVIECIPYQSLKSGNSTQCKDCANKERNQAKVLDSTRYFNETYGEERGRKLTRLYGKRFEHPRHGKPGPKFYGPWKTDYKAFAKYLVALPDFDQWPELSLDRIGTNGAYEPGNLRFTTIDEQMSNRTSTHFIEFNGAEVPLADFVKLVLGPRYHGSKPYGWISVRRSQSAEQIIEALANKVRLSKSRPSTWPDGPTKTHFIRFYNERKTHEF